MVRKRACRSIYLICSRTPMFSEQPSQHPHATQIVSCCVNANVSAHSTVTSSLTADKCTTWDLLYSLLKWGDSGKSRHHCIYGYFGHGAVRLGCHGAVRLGCHGAACMANLTIWIVAGFVVGRTVTAPRIRAKTVDPRGCTLHAARCWCIYAC